MDCSFAVVGTGEVGMKKGANCTSSTPRQWERGPGVKVVTQLKRFSACQLKVVKFVFPLVCLHDDDNIISYHHHVISTLSVEAYKTYIEGMTVLVRQYKGGKRDTVGACILKPLDSR